MLKATFTELRQHAKIYFDAVEEGETIQIFRHGKIIAEICPASNQEKTLSWKRAALKLAVKGASLTKVILEDREKGK